jgi:hypothetical protein
MNLQYEGDQRTWSAPEYVKLESIVVVEHGRLPIDEAVVMDIMATIGAGDISALPPIHLWRKQPGGNPILVAGRNRLEAHKRCGREVIIARVITGETPEIVRAVQLIEIDENLNRRELSPALRRSLTKQRKGLYEEDHPETKRGSAGGRAKAGKGARSQNATEQTLAFIDVHAKQTGHLPSRRSPTPAAPARVGSPRRGLSRRPEMGQGWGSKSHAGPFAEAGAGVQPEGSSEHRCFLADHVRTRRKQTSER